MTVRPKKIKATSDTKKTRRRTHWLKEPPPLQQDVRDLEAYNAKAEKQGKPALSYGYWAAKGKPARP